MKTIEKIVSELKEELRQAEQQQKNVWRDKVKLSNESDVNIFDTFISYKCKNLNDISNVLKNLETFREMGNIKGSNKEYYTTSPTRYRINIKNNYHSRELQIIFGMLNIDIHIDIDFKHLPNEFINDFFVNTSRKLYDTETVYVNIPSHYKAFKNIRIQSYRFAENDNVIGWYGGDITQLNSDVINKIINELLK